MTKPGMVALAAGLVGYALLSSSAEAQLKLRVVDALPVGHYIEQYATRFWMEESRRLANGAVEFEYFPSEQLGKAKDILSLTQTGVADVGYVATSYVSEKLPLSSVAELPGSFQSSCQGTMAYLKLATGDGILAKQEFEANGVRVLFALTLSPYQLLTVNRRVDTVQGASGLKIRIPGGGALDAVTRGMNAVPVRISSPELHEALSRGTIDGLLFPFGSVFTYDLAPLLKYATTGENFGTAVITYVMSTQKWKTLAPDIQNALMKAGRAASERACALMDGDVEKEAARLAAARVELVKIPAENRAALMALNERVAQEWAEQLDKRGKPGSQVLQAFRGALSH